MPISEIERAFLEDKYLISVPGSELGEEELTPDQINSALDAVVNNQNRGRGPKPVISIGRLLSTIEGKEDEPFTLDELSQQFLDTSNSRKSAANFISWINKQFRGLELGIEITAERQTVYSFKKT